MPTRMVVDREKLDRLRRAFGVQGVGTVIRAASRQFAPILWRELALRSPVGGTGALRQQWRVTVNPTGVGVLVTNAAKQAVFIHYGTRPHTIVPRRKKVLAWRSGGRGAASAFQPRGRSGGTGGNRGAMYQELRGKGSKVVPDVFARVVRHPGSRARDLVTPAWENKARTFLQVIHEHLDRAVARFAS